MKNRNLFVVVILFMVMLNFQNCGPVVISSRPHYPLPAWFYPNRVENVRYIYFPDHTIYYDLSLRNYLYLDNGIWISAGVLPSRFNSINLRRSRHVRIHNYFGDNIRDYHSKYRADFRSRRAKTTRRR